MNTARHLALALPFAVLFGCGGAGGGGTGADTAAAGATTEPPANGAKVLKLKGSLSVKQNYSLVGKPQSNGSSSESTNEFVVLGSFEQLVTVDVNSATGDLVFRAVSGKAPEVHATVTERTHCQSTNPADATVVSVVGDSSYSGQIDGVSYGVSSSRLGVGDELSFSLTGSAAGKASWAYTAPNGVTQTVSTGCVAVPRLLEVDFEKAPTTARMPATLSWKLLPALGARPDDAFYANLYDALKANPRLQHVGAVTSAARNRWTYEGTKVIADKDDANEKTLWTEDVAVTWELLTP